MKNLFDYLTYYGNLSFDDYAFNEVDSLILSLLSYVKFNQIVPNGKNDFIYLEEACFKFLKKYSEKNFKKEDLISYILSPLSEIENKDEKISEILKIKYNLKIVNNNPLRLNRYY